MNVIDNSSRIPDIKEAYKNIHNALGDEVFKQYSIFLKLHFSSKITKLKFDEEARKLFVIPEQLHLHNLFLLSLSSKTINHQFNDEIHSKKIKFCAQEMCLPNEELLKDRITITAIDHGLESAEDDVYEMISLASQIFLKNIITAVVSRTSGYKFRENAFQHGIGLPAPNPWLRNTSNIIDSTQNTNVTLNDEEQCFEPMVKDNLEMSEQQTAFSFACGSTPTQNFKKMTLKSLYETLLHDPTIIRNHTINSMNLERMLAQLDCP